MTSYEVGRLAGFVFFPILVAAIVYGVGRLATVRLEPVRQRRARRGTSIAAVTVGLAIAAINLSPLIKLGGEDDARLPGRFLSSFQKGCQDRCAERGGTKARCVAFCGCAARELSRRASRDELMTRKIDATLRKKMADAALACVNKAPPAVR